MDGYAALEVFVRVGAFLEEDGYETRYLRSGGADSLRPIKFRNKPSTGEWFLWEQLLLAGIREPASKDPWR